MYPQDGKLKKMFKKYLRAKIAEKKITVGQKLIKCLQLSARVLSASKQKNMQHSAQACSQQTALSTQHLLMKLIESDVLGMFSAVYCLTIAALDGRNSR